jgi:hypothetical protein
VSASGTWTITAQTPIGEQSSTVELTEADGKIEGRMTAPEEAAIYDGKASGNEVEWRVDITKPMALKLHVAGTIDGDTITGKIKAGMMFPSASFTAQRQS